jgi:hypothetical protein
MLPSACVSVERIAVCVAESRHRKSVRFVAHSEKGHDVTVAEMGPQAQSQPKRTQ